MGPLSDRDLRTIVKSLGRTSDALDEKLERVTGALYETTRDDLDHIDGLLARLRNEQSRRRGRHNAA